MEECDTGLAAIVNTSIEGIIGKTSRGDVVSWNKGAERIYGYTEKEMRGKNISLLAPPGYKEEIIDQLQKLKEGGLIKNHETNSCNSFIIHFFQWGGSESFAGILIKKSQGMLRS